MVPVSHFMGLSAILFLLGVAGFLLRRSLLTLFLSVQLMLNAVGLSLVTLSYYYRQVDAQVLALFLMVLVAAEAVVGLAYLLAVYRDRGTLDADELDELKG